MRARTRERALVGTRAMVMAVAGEITSSVTRACTNIKVSQISSALGHDRSVEIYHRAIGSYSSADYAVRVMACATAEPHMGSMRRDVPQVR